MRIHPFPLFEQFRDLLDIHFLARGDSVGSDDAIARLTGASSLASLQQMHGNRAIILRSDSRRSEQADALATDKSGLTLTIRFADCQNFLVYAPEKNVVCLIHAGWRGLRSGIIANAFALLRSEWSIDPEETFVAAGPSLCVSCATFMDPAKEVPELSEYIDGRCIDLRRAADDQIRYLGVPASQCARLFGCTRCSPDLYWSFRGGDREAVKSGKVNCLAVTLAGRGICA